MTEQQLPAGLLERLRAVDTPTVCNAIEVAQGRRGFANFTRTTMHISDPGASALAGFARTATIAGANPPEEPVAEIRARRMDYFRSMADGPRPAIAVVEDADGAGSCSAWWGEVHSTVHKGLGLAGAVTNGLMRDLGDLEPGFPIIAGGIGPSHSFVHVKAIGTPVDIFGMRVNQGDLIHADRHGALVVPSDVLDTLTTAIDTLQASEAIILGPAREPGFSMEKLETAWAAFEKART